MAITLNKLTALDVRNITKPGRHADGGNLYLLVSPRGAKSWVFIYRCRRTHKRRDMGLGSITSVSLASARSKAASLRDTLASGRDPFDDRKAEEDARVAARDVPTFGAMADDFIASREASWRNDKHVAQWKMTLKHYAAPLTPKPVDQISIEDVLSVLKPIWQTKPETARRLRGRIESVLDAAKAKGHGRAENPARWKGNLDYLLPQAKKLSRGHHRAMPYGDVPGFMSKLHALQQGPSETVSAYALEFLILTAVRTGELAIKRRGAKILGARWDEIDDDAKTWTIPAERMKGKHPKPHVVPLVGRALEILKTMAPFKRAGDFVFPGQKPGRPISEMAMAMVLRRLKVDNVATVHGFRSTFRDWAGDCTSFPREVAEAALSHAVGSNTERAYRRATALAKRRDLMEKWEVYCSGDTNIVQLHVANAKS